MSKNGLDYFSVEELAAHILGVSIDTDEEYDALEEKLSDRYFLAMDDFYDIVSKLVPLIDIGTSPLTQTRYKGFADTENQRWLVKIEV